MVKTRGPTWEPGPEDYGRVFAEQNPWHANGLVPDALAYQVERPLADSLWGRLVCGEPRRFQLVLGPRRVGKTTCLYQTVRRLLREGVVPARLWWLRLDHPLFMQVPLDVLVRFTVELSKATPAEPAFLFLDELTYAPDWDLWLKTFFDEQWPVRLAGSSSSTAAIKGRRMESGVGRWDEQYLAPYLFNEYLALKGTQREIPVEDTLAKTLLACADEGVNTQDLRSLRQAYLLTGGFPELLVDAAESQNGITHRLLQSQRTLQSDAVERAIYKDIPQAYGVDSPMLLERMLYTLAGQVTGVLSPTDLCRNLDGLSFPTFDRYLAYLTKAFLVFALSNYSGSEAKTQKRGRKLYFVDGAIRNAALQRGVAPLQDPAEIGLLLENLVAGHLHALSQQTQVRLYHWREKSVEVDLVYDHPSEPLAFEVGSSPKTARYAIHEFTKRFPRFEGRSYIVAPDILATPPGKAWDRVGTLPLDLLLLAAGCQAERALKLRLAP
jgi:hypothetical protein